MIYLKQYLHDIIYDKKSNAAALVVKFFLALISVFYGILVKMHHFFYQVKLLKSRKSRIPVVSVGNITLGGTGKTPFVIMLSKRLSQRGRKTAVLIRGYGEDEWKMLKNKLERYGVKVFVGRDRVKSAGFAEKEGFDYIVLDDGFQHRRLARDIDIVLIDSTNPFGNGCLFPRGILRETVSGLKRASFIVLTKTDKGKEAGMLSLENKLKDIAPVKKVIRAAHMPKALFDIRKKTSEDLKFLSGKTVCIMSAICDPSYFRYTVEKNNAQVGLEFIFPDHYPYKEDDLRNVFKRCKEKDIDVIVTTEKDAAKLERLKLPPNTCRIFALCVDLEITKGAEVLDDYFNT